MNVFDYTRIALSWIVLVLSGCAAVPPSARMDTASTASSPCCARLDQLPEPQPLFHSQQVSLREDAPLLELDGKTLPFRHFSVAPGSVRFLELWVKEAASRGSAQDRNTLHYVPPKVVFFDAAGRAIATEPPGKPSLKANGLWGDFVLTFHVSVPTQAQRFVLTVAPEVVGTGSEAFGFRPPMTYYIPVFPGGMSVSTGGGGRWGFLYRDRGEVIIHAWGAPLNPAIPQRR